MRQRLGRITYYRKEQADPDPAREDARRRALMTWRREQLRLQARQHINRMVAEDGLSRSISELHDRKGQPPPNVSLERMIRQYNRLLRQRGWLEAIAMECRKQLREIDLVGYLKGKAAVEDDLARRSVERQDIFHESTSTKDGDATKLPSKLRYMIREVIKKDLRRKERRRARLPLSENYSILMSSRMGEIMQFIFAEHIPEGHEPDGLTDPKYRFAYLSDALEEIEILLEDMNSNIYDLREYVESADLFLARGGV